MDEREKYPVFERLLYRVELPLDAQYPMAFSEAKAVVADGGIEYGLLLPQEVCLCGIFEEMLSF